MRSRNRGQSHFFKIWGTIPTIIFLEYTMAKNQDTKFIFTVRLGSDGKGVIPSKQAKFSKVVEKSHT